MSNVSYIRHHDGIGSDMGDSGPASPTSKSAKLALMEKRQRKEQQKRDEFDTEDGLQAFMLALHNLLITCSWVLVLANVTGWHKMTWIGVISVVSHLVLTELLMRGIRRNSIKLVIPWLAVCILEEILMFVLSVGWISRSLEGVSFGQGFSIIGGFFVMNTILTGARYFIMAKTFLNCYRTQYQKI